MYEEFNPRLQPISSETYNFLQQAGKIAALVGPELSNITEYRTPLVSINTALALSVAAIGSWGEAVHVASQYKDRDPYWEIMDALIVLAGEESDDLRSALRDSSSVSNTSLNTPTVKLVGSQARTLDFFAQGGLVNRDTTSIAPQLLSNLLEEVLHETLSYQPLLTSERRRQTIQEILCEGWQGENFRAIPCRFNELLYTVHTRLNDSAFLDTLENTDACSLLGTVAGFSALQEEGQSIALHQSRRLKDFIDAQSDRKKSLAFSLSCAFLTSISDVFDLARKKALSSDMRESIHWIDEQHFQELAPMGMRTEIDYVVRGKDLLQDSAEDLSDTDWTLHVLKNWALSLCHNFLDQEQRETFALDSAIGSAHGQIGSSLTFGALPFYERAIMHRKNLCPSFVDPTNIAGLRLFFEGDARLFWHEGAPEDIRTATFACEVMEATIPYAEEFAQLPKNVFVDAAVGVAEGIIAKNLPYLAVRRWIA